MRKTMRIAALLICACFLVGLTVMAADSNENELAADYMVAHGIYQGDASGNLNLESGLTRAELATVLARLRGDGQAVVDNAADYAWSCHFVDVPAWAKPYVGYCAENSLMQGYSVTHFGPSDSVTPGQACTVILRHMGYPETDWSYQTAIAKARAVGIAPDSGLEGATITRGTIAVLIYRAIGKEAAPAVEPTGQAIADGSGRVYDTPITTKTIGGVELAREDFSQQANPAIFQGGYTRGMYNALRQSWLDRDIIWPGNRGKTAAESFNPYYAYAHALPGSYEASLPFEQIVADMTALYGYSVNAEPFAKDLWQYPGYFIVTVMKTDYSLGTRTQAVLIASQNETDTAKIRSFSDYVRTRIVYDARASAGIESTFSDGAPVKGACGTYAKCFKYLCDMEGIPCFIIAGDNHAWAMVYVNGSWYHCDPTNNQVLTETINFTPYNLQDVAFTKEILVPGSTK